MRITPLAKLFITLMILAVTGYVAWYRLHAPAAGGHLAALDRESRFGSAAVDQSAAEHDHDHDHPAPGIRASRVAPLRIAFEDAAAICAGALAKQGGAAIELRRVRGVEARLAALARGEVDIISLTVDQLARLAQGGDRDPAQAFLLHAFSRGEVGIAVGPKLRSVEDLSGARIATSKDSPAHFFLLMMMDDANLSEAQITRTRARLIFATRPAYTAELFQRGEADAVATSEPHLSRAIAGGKGRPLITTATASHLVAHLLVARQSLLRGREGDVIALTRAWLQGVTTARREQQPRGRGGPREQTSTAAACEAALSDAAAGEGDTLAARLARVHLTGYPENRDFLGVEREDSLFMEVYAHAARLWKREGRARAEAPATGERARWLHALEAVRGEHVGERLEAEFNFHRARSGTAAPVMTKTATILFPSGGAVLDAKAKATVDGFAEEIAELGNAVIRVEGHTDSIGPAARNRELSQRRAQAVVDHLVQTRGFERERFEAVGYGAERPKGSNASDQGRGLNRRTDFAIIPNE